MSSYVANVEAASTIRLYALAASPTPDSHPALFCTFSLLVVRVVLLHR